MNTFTQQTIDIFEKLDEVSKLEVLRYAESLAAGNDSDIELYDKAKSTDDGYRVTAAELRERYGL